MDSKHSGQRIGPHARDADHVRIGTIVAETRSIHGISIRMSQDFASGTYIRTETDGCSKI